MHVDGANSPGATGHQYVGYMGSRQKSNRVHHALRTKSSLITEFFFETMYV